MDNVQLELKRIDELQTDLSAKITVSPAETEIVPRWTRNPTYPKLSKEERDARVDVPDDFFVETSECIVIKPKVTEPDIDKRGNAQACLQHICESSEWYSGRYKAALALHVDEETLTQKINTWLAALEERLKNPQENDSASQDAYAFYGIATTKELRRHIGGILGLPEEQILANEMQRRTPLTRNELRTIYKSNTLSDSKVIVRAGELLGYEFVELRLWLRRLINNALRRKR